VAPPTTEADGPLADLVLAFYAAVNAHDAAAIAGLVDERFAADAVLLLPPSLPYGGRFQGAATLRKLFTAMATAATPIGPDAIRVVEVIASGDGVAVRLEFDWCPPGSTTSIPSGAVEVWNFRQGRVREIRAFYWDTAQCVRHAGTAVT
jgi:ketosteroid isomerase-like protein